MAKKRFGKSATTDDLLRSDSDDENYTEGPAERSPKKSGGGRKQPASRAGTKRKNGSRSKTTKRRGTYSDVSDDVSDIEDDESEDDFISEEEHEEQHPVEIGATGRTKRVVACKPTNYKESDSDSDEQVALSSSEVEDDRSNQPREPRSLIVTLKLEKSALARFEEQPSTRSQLLPRPKRQKLQKDPPILATSGRVTRATSAIPLSAVQTRVTAGGKAPPRGAARTRGRQVSAEPTRKSGRIHNTQEPMAALSNSGNHVVVTNLPPPTVSTVREESPVEDEEVVEVLQPQKTQVTAIEEDTEPLSVEPATVNRVSSQLEIQDSQHEENDHSIEVEGSALVAESVALYSSGQEGDADEEEEEEEEDGPTKRTRTRAASRQRSTTSLKTLRPTDVTASEPILEKAKEPDGSRRMLGRRSKSTRGAAKGGASDDEDYHEEGAEQSDDSQSSGGRTPAKPTRSQGHRDHDEDEEYSDPNRRSTGSKRHRLSGSDPESQAELQQEVKDLQRSSKRTRLAKARELSGHESGSPKARRPKRKTAQSVDYRVVRPELTQVLDDGDGTSTSSKRKAVPPTRSLFDTNGPFGGGDVMPFFLRAAGLQNEPDSDSSDDDAIRRRGRGAFGGTVGMTPTGAHAPGLLPGVGQTHNTDPMQAGAPANMGRITKPSKNALADADPLGVSAEVNFDSVGGLDDRIQQLKEMVMLPLMYPEIFLAKKVTPPRGVLFHGPPGTGKTLLARAVASSFADANGKKVTFYMRKGADCLSKWVGEAERQLRLLFDEARNNQPSIIFFDEIDGLAPVRSSKQEQIHASIVSTLLALMDGMDGRGQVVVIGATNRPDAVDPALRRPGRFDREFYFPLPTTVARRSILDIHTKGWEPPLTDAFKDQLATLTKGYGGADLRALCTEAALNAMQRTYPQIYKSMDKLKVDPASVVVTARDFMMSLRKITPSSERSTASGASPLPEHVQPLLQNQLERIKERLKGIFPEFKRLSPLEDAEYEDEDLDAEQGFQREMMMESEFARFLDCLGWC